MRVGKEYYIAVRGNRMATGSVLSYYQDNYVVDKVVETTKEVDEVQVFNEYAEALEFAERYGLEVKKLRADIIGLYSK